MTLLERQQSVPDRLNGWRAANVDIDFERLHDVHPALAKFRSRLGNTSLEQMPNPRGGGVVLAKLEMENPAGSVKDRVAYALICDLLDKARGRDATDIHLLEYSGGNLALGMSYLGRELGMRMTFVLSAAAPTTLLDELEARGATVRLAPRTVGFLGVIEEAHRMAVADPTLSFPFQHANSVNLAFHEATTGLEIVAQLEDREPVAWVASIGTGGTLVGVHRALRSRWPTIAAIGVTPAELPYGSPQPPNAEPKLAGSGGLGNGLRQPFVRWHSGAVSEHRYVPYPAALAGMAEFFRLTGKRIGSSAAANWLVACERAEALPSHQCVVTVFPCAGQPAEWRAAGLPV